MKKILIIFAVLCAAAVAQSGHAAWPGQTGNTVGFAGYGTLSSTACGAFSSGSSWATATRVHDCKYSTAQTVNCNFCKFQNVDFDAGTGGTNFSGSNIICEGCRFQSNAVGFFNVRATGSNLWLFYPSVVPRTTFYAAPPGSQPWPSFDGSQANTTTQTNGGTSVNGSNGYQYGINVVGGASTVVFGADIWGFGNADDMGSTSGNTWLINSWIHDAAFADTQGYHTDGPSYLNGGAAPSNIYLFGNVVSSLGNTNAMAFQQATSSYNNMNSLDNYWTGFGNTISPGDIAPQHFTNSTLINQYFGTDVEPLNAIFHGTTLGSNTLWACNQIVFASSTSWTSGGYTPVSGDNGKYWVLSSSAPASATDQSSNTVCGTPNPSNLFFLDQPNNTTSGTKTITLKNTNSASWSVTAVAMAVGAQGFSVTGGTCSSTCTLTTGQTGTIQIQFSPTSLGPALDQVQITNNMTSPASTLLIPVLGVSCTNGVDCASPLGGASSPSCSPTGGTFVGSVTVTCTNPNSGTTDICYSTSTTPATDGTGTGCTTGTKYTTPLVFSTTTAALKVIAGTSTLADSSVVTYGAYTINPASATDMNVNGITFSNGITVSQ